MMNNPIINDSLIPNALIIRPNSMLLGHRSSLTNGKGVITECAE